MRILVTSAGGALAPLNIRLMKESGRHAMWVLAVDQRADAAGRYFADKFVVVPPGGSAGYSESITRLATEHGIELVLPWSDEEALALAGARSAIEATGAKLACARIETLQQMSDKAATYRRLAAAGLAMPEWVVAEDAPAFARAVDDFAARGEFAIKPIRARGNRGTIIVRRDVEGVVSYLGSRERHCDLATFRAKLQPEAARNLPAIVMERLYPPAYDVDVLAWQGKTLRCMPRRRINPAGVPFLGGVLMPLPEFLDLARQVTAALNVSWLYDYDLMTDRAGRPAVIEVNPRPSGSIAASILAGVPFYDDLVSLAKGERLPDIPLPEEVAVVPYLDCRIVPVGQLA